jgi:hypothetical protein
MYSRAEASRIREEFWTAFGKYMAPVPSAEGAYINWVNYHTGIKHVYFRMDADGKGASIAISIEHPDQLVRELYFEQFIPLRAMLHQQLHEEWDWLLNVAANHGKTASKIQKQLHGVSVFNRNEWPGLITFFKPRIIALDNFWSNVKDGFESL